MKRKYANGEEDRFMVQVTIVLVALHALCLFW